MSVSAGGPSKSPSNAWDAADRAGRRGALAVALVVHGVLIAGLAPLFAKRRFIRIDDDLIHTTYSFGDGKYVTTTSTWYSLTDLLSGHPGWAIPAASFVLIPLCYWWWRKAGLSFGRAIGVLVSSATIAGLCLQLRTAGGVGFLWWITSAVLFVLAFLVAPDPRDPDAIGSFALRRMKRRHRESV